MRRSLVSLVLLPVLGALAACSGGGHPQAERRPLDNPGDHVLGIVWREDSAALVRLASGSLAPASKPLALGHDGETWSFSPDHARLALAGGQPLEVRIVEARRMKAVGVVRLSGGPVSLPTQANVIALAWSSPNRVLALLEWGAWKHAVVVVDALERHVLSREPIAGTLVAEARTRGGLALLLAPRARIGPARLLLVDAAGRERSISRLETGAGLFPIDPDSNDELARIRSLALAVDPAGRRALVIPGEGPVADVDLVTGRVSYRTVRETVSLLGRLRAWLEPEAEAKAQDGPTRQAVWVAKDLVAVTGQDAAAAGRAGHEQETTTPAGLSLIDTRRWTKRTLDEHASQLSVSNGALLAYGTSWNSRTQVTKGMGLTAFGLDGKKRFHLFGDEPIYYMQTAGRYAYVWREQDAPATVDLRTGRVVRELSRYRRTDIPALVSSR
ncbi:hypothetical protein BH18ACT14_BH18ACT14_11660 [soil metagenome]